MRDGKERERGRTIGFSRTTGSALSSVARFYAIGSCHQDLHIQILSPALARMYTFKTTHDTPLNKTLQEIEVDKCSRQC